jgi:hypothetical protein
MLAPEQLRALDYLRRKGTEAPAADLQRSVGDGASGSRPFSASWFSSMCHWPAAARRVTPLAIPWGDLVRELRSVHAGIERILDTLGERLSG